MVAFERVTAFSPDRFGLFVAVSYAKLNAVRTEKVAAARAKGYRLVSYLSSRATVFPGFEAQGELLHPRRQHDPALRRVGANVTLWSGNHIGHHSIIEDDVFLASHVVVSGGVRIGQGSFVGVNVTLRDHCRSGGNACSAPAPGARRSTRLFRRRAARDRAFQGSEHAASRP